MRLYRALFLLSGLGFLLFCEMWGLPEWWSRRGILEEGWVEFTPEAVHANHAAATYGQLLNMLDGALEELDPDA